MHENKDRSNVIEQGFTLIELLVVIAILGILAAVVVFSVQGITDRGSSSACKTEVATVNTATQAFYAKNPATTPFYPPGPESALLGQLQTAQLLSSSSTLGATASYSPAYDPATGTFSAACP